MSSSQWILLSCLRPLFEALLDPNLELGVQGVVTGIGGGTDDRREGRIDQELPANDYC